jgi:transcriptional regulator with XRE-family HTH domain
VEVLDVIRQLCKQKNISLSQLENELEYGNGSIAKSKGNMSADRMYQIAKYFNVPMEYLMTGKQINEVDEEVAIIRQQQSILLEINKVSQDMADHYKAISDCQEQLSKLKQDYGDLEQKKHKDEPATVTMAESDTKATSRPTMRTIKLQDLKKQTTNGTEGEDFF